MSKIIDLDKKRKEKEGQKVYYLRNPWHPINRFEDLKKEMELMKNPPDLGIRIIAYDNTKKSWISKLLDLFKRRKIE